MARVVVLVLMLIGACSNCFAALVQVSYSSFGPTALNETFNEPIDYSNAVNCPIADKFGSMVLIGTHDVYTFSQTGIKYISPIPNIFEDFHHVVSVVNDKQYFNFGVYGELMPNSGVIPGGPGAKFLLEVGSSSIHLSPIMLEFPDQGALKVGGNFIMAATYPDQPDNIVVTAYDIFGSLLGTVYIPPTTVANWANSFYGFASSDGTAIKTIGIDYSSNPNACRPGVANLTFEPVPEPSTLALLSLCGALLMRKKRN